MNSDNYKINTDKWSPPPPDTGVIPEKYRFNPNKWVNIEKKNIHPKKKYYLATIFFITSLIAVSTIKNETRNLEKEIVDLQASLSSIKITLHEAILDHEVITSPENISKLAEEHLENNFSFYKKDQLRQINDDEKLSAKLDKKTKKISDKVKIQLSKKIEEKKAELKYYKSLYSEPEKLPEEIKSKISKNIATTKEELEKLYSDPQGTIKSQKIQRWAMLQIIKAFFGIPIVPGK